MRFELKALRAATDVVCVSLDALDAQDAVAQAQAQGYTVLTVKARRPAAGWLAARRTHFPLLLFSQELLALLDAGLTLVDGIETLAEKEAKPEFRKMLQHILALLYEGRPLSQALQAHPRAFPALYVATVRASERTGDIGEALSRYIAYQRQIDAVRAKVVSASIYPLLLVVAGGLVTAFLLGYVVPRFSVIYESLGSDLPALSRLLLAWGRALETHGTLMLATVLAAGAAAAYGCRRTGLKARALRALWRIPAVGERMRLYQLARYYRTLGMLLRGGTPVAPALDMAAGLLQPGLRAQLAAASRTISEGRSISYAMDAHGLATPVALRMLRVGERTGRMGDMMERIAAFYDEEMARWVERFTRLFEPLLMAFIGLVIGLIVILMYLPIFELAGSLQ